MSNELKKDFRTLASCYDSLILGDTHKVETATIIMQKYKFWDKDGFWAYGEEEND